jgi:hypothetical protein
MTDFHDSNDFRDRLVQALADEIQRHEARQPLPRARSQAELWRAAVGVATLIISTISLILALTNGG